jgi:hypothetical protein
MPSRRSRSASSSSSSSVASQRNYRALTLQERLHRLNDIESVDKRNPAWGITKHRLVCNLCKKKVRADTNSIYQHRRGVSHQGFVRDLKAAKDANCSPRPTRPPLAPEAPERRQRSCGEDEPFTAVNESAAKQHASASWRESAVAQRESAVALRESAVAQRELAIARRESALAQRESAAELVWERQSAAPASALGAACDVARSCH